MKAALDACLNHLAPKATIHISGAPDKTLKAVVHESEGDARIEWTFRRMSNGQSSVLHDEVKVNGSLRGRDLARAVWRATEPHYASLGFKWIEIEAMGEGAYLWTSEGYRFRPWNASAGDPAALLTDPDALAECARDWVARQNRAGRATKPSGPTAGRRRRPQVRGRHRAP